MNGVTPLLLAAKSGNRAIVQVLLNHPMIDVAIADRIFFIVFIHCGVFIVYFFYQTPYIAACRSKLTEIANLIRVKMPKTPKLVST